MNYLLKIAAMAVSMIGSLFATINTPKPVAMTQAPVSTKPAVVKAADRQAGSATKTIVVSLPPAFMPQAPSDDAGLSKLFSHTYNVKALHDDKPWFLRLDSISVEPFSEQFDLFAINDPTSVD